MSATVTGDDLYRTDSAARSSRIAFGALLLRDLWVLRKNLRAFIPRTIVQPLLLCFVFLYVFPTIGTGVGGGRGGASESDFATILVAGVIGLSIMFQGIQAVALPMVQEFGYTKEIEDRVLAPLPVVLVALEKVVFGALQGLLAAAIVFPIAAVVHASSIHINLQVHWLTLVTLIPLACITCSALGLTFGTIFDPRNVPLHVRDHHPAADVSGRHVLRVDDARAGQGGGPTVAAVRGADQPAGLHQRGIARGADLVQPHVAVGRLPGVGRVQRALPVGRHAELHPPGDQLVRREQCR